MEMLTARQRVVAVSLWRRRPALMPDGQGDDEAYRLWYELVCNEVQRLGIVEPRRIQAFCDRAGVPAGSGVPLSAVPPTAA